MFTLPTAWNELYGPPPTPAPPPEAASRRPGRVFAAATTAPAVTAPPHTLADGRVGGRFSGYAYHRAVPPPAHALFATPTTSGFFPASSRYTVASQPVRRFPLPPTPAAARTYYESHPYTSAYSGDGGGWSYAENAPTGENSYESVGPQGTAAPWRHGTCTPHQLLQSQLRVSGTMDPVAAGGVLGAGAAAAPYAMHTAHSAEMAAGAAEEEAWEGGATMPYGPGMPGASRPLHRPPPPTHDNPMSNCRGATLWPVAQSVSPVERGGAAKAAAQDGSRLHYAAYASREGRQHAAVGIKLAAHTPHDVDGRYTDGRLLAPPRPPRPPSPRHEHSDQQQQQQLQQAPEYSSISDGARHLNSARHRSAASAAAFFFHSPSVTDGFASSSCAGGPAAFRAGGRAAAATSAISSTATFLSATGASAMVVATAASAAAAQAEPCCVAALIFNNAKEVGVALCELPSLTVSLFQYGDTATFFKTASLLHTRNPVEVLVPSTAVDSELVQTVLRQHGAHMTFTSVQRCFYNAEEGVQRLSQLKSSAEASLCIEDTDRYLCVAAANAVVLYMEHVNDMHLLPGSVRVRAEALEHYMEVSRTTARVLQIIPDTACVSAAAAAASMELMRNAANGSERADRQQRVRAQRYGAARTPMFLGHDLANPPPLQTVALVDAIPRACTVMGQRYLRRTLLQPLRDRVAVQGRHDAVEWLLCEPRRLHMLRALLRHTAALDLERLTATLTHQPRRERSSAQQQSYLESLQLLWSALPHLEQLHIQLKAYLGPLPRVQAPVNREGVPPSTPPPLPGGGSDAAAPSHDLRSSAAHPSVLHSIATALGQCRFPELETLMGTYLERSVLPSVVAHHEKSAAHCGALHGADTGSTHIPPSVSVMAQQQQPQRRRRRLRSDDGAALDSHQHPQERSQRATAVFLRLLRMCFLVQAPHSGELDALRTRLSLRISDITSYAAELRATYRIFSLRLEPDPVKLYCFSYAVAEEAKAQAGPFTWRYAGGSHFALYLSALREQQQLWRQREQQQGQGQTLRSSQWHPPSSAGDPLCTASSSPPTELARHTSDADGAEFESSAIDPFSPFTSGTNYTAPCQLRRRRVRCSTEDLDYRCARAQECVVAILQLQLHSVQPLVRAIQHEFLGSLQATVESVALLDTLLCFAFYSLTHQCTRPVLVELRTGSTTTAPRVRTSMTERPGDGEAVASSGRRATSVAGGAGASWDRVDESINATGAAAGVGDQGGGTAASAGTSETSSDAATPSCTPSMSTLTAHAMTSAAATTETETRHTSGVRLCLENALHPSATQRQPPSREVARAGLSARWTGAEVGGMSRPASDSSGGLTMSWGSGGGHVCVVTGPNACGKTTLLRILGQYFTLAQAGCFVPAQHAQLFLADRLLAHMLCDELPSITHSSFRRELMELSELTHAATAESVALIDELGRSTTTAQGFSLAWATALLLSDRRVHSVLTTHYAGLPSLARVRPTRVVAFHFRVTFQHLAARDEGRDGVADSSWRGPARTRITIARFGHTLFPGPCPQRWYGLALAEKLHFFEPVLAMARRTRTCPSPAEAHTEENEV